MNKPDLNQIAEEARSTLDRIESVSETTTKFLDNITNPDHRVYGFRWAEGAIEEAVRRDALCQILDAAENWIKRISDGESTEDKALAAISNHFKREMMNRASSSNQSTSTMSNLVERLELARYAKIVEWLSGEGFGSL